MIMVFIFLLQYFIIYKLVFFDKFPLRETHLKYLESAAFPFLFLARGHRVLLFSQMTQMLDILQDYMDYRGDIPWPLHCLSLF